MNTLEAVGVVSLAIVVSFVWWTYRAGIAPRAAMFEAVANLIAGFGVNMAANFILLPLVGVKPTTGSMLWLGMPYTVISLLRQYAIRRWLGQWFHAASVRLATLFEAD